jgi:hypothetical protein
LHFAGIVDIEPSGETSVRRRHVPRQHVRFSTTSLTSNLAMSTTKSLSVIFLSLHVFHTVVTGVPLLFTFEPMVTINNCALVLIFLATISAILGVCCMKHRSKFLTAYSFLQGSLLGSALAYVIYGFVVIYLHGDLSLGIFHP